MNYRHGFHAGNFADVHKHAIFANIVGYLTGKASAFHVLDTHSGAGQYDLEGDEAGRTGEWRGGIGRLMTQTAPPAAEAVLAPYRMALAHYDSGQQLTTYAGSALIALALMRPQDRLTACEIEEMAAAALSSSLGSDRRAKAVVIDGWTALRAYLPPKERRGVVLIDPPYERTDEFGRLAAAIVAAHRKWPTGIFVAWYPIKDRRGPDGVAQALQEEAIPRVLRSEIMVRQELGPGLSGSGVIIINPPWLLHAQIAALGPPLAAMLATAPGGGARLDWLGRDG
jgi:23S rRNA (adenine2030-N6)-methyltransferase